MQLYHYDSSNRFMTDEEAFFDWGFTHRLTSGEFAKLTPYPSVRGQSPFPAHLIEGELKVTEFKDPE